MITNTNSTMIPPTYKMTCTMKRNSASSSRKNPAVASSVVIKNTALCTIFLRVTIKTAEATAIPAKTINSAWFSVCICLFTVQQMSRSRRRIILRQEHRHAQSPERCRNQRHNRPPSELLPQHNRHAHADHVHQGQRNQESPAQPHQLVEAIARKCKPYPQERVNVCEHFRHEPKSPMNALHHSRRSNQSARQYAGYAQAQQRNQHHHDFLNFHRLLRCQRQRIQRDA